MSTKRTSKTGKAFTAALYYVGMKRTLGTVVLFILLILTVVALTQLDPSDTSAQKLDVSSAHGTR